MSYRYLIGGLTVVSDVALVGARAVAGEGPADVWIARGETPEELDSATVRRNHWSADASRVLVHAATGRYLVTGGREIRYQPQPGCSVEDCVPYLSGSVFGFLLHQRGEVLLHASAVSVGGRAVLFSGQSGLGKSTLAATLCQRGHPLLADDFCVVTLGADGAPAVTADARLHRLTGPTIRALRSPNVMQPVQFKLDKFYVEPALCAEHGKAPLAQLYFLERGPAPLIGPLSTAEAVRALQASAYRPQFVKRMGHAGTYLQAATAILRHAGMSRLVLQEGLDSLDATIDLIETGTARATPQTTGPIQ